MITEDFAAAGIIKQEIEALEKTNPEKAAANGADAASSGRGGKVAAAAASGAKKESGEEEAARMLRERCLPKHPSAVIVFSSNQTLSLTTLSLTTLHVLLPSELYVPTSPASPIVLLL